MDWEQLAKIANLLKTELGVATDITPEQVKQLVQAKLPEVVNKNNITNNTELAQA